jgi:hypothetical protein
VSCSELLEIPRRAFKLTHAKSLIWIVWPAMGYFFPARSPFACEDFFDRPIAGNLTTTLFNNSRILSYYLPVSAIACSLARREGLPPLHLCCENQCRHFISRDLSSNSIQYDAVTLACAEKFQGKSPVLHLGQLSYTCTAIYAFFEFRSGIERLASIAVIKPLRGCH